MLRDGLPRHDFGLIASARLIHHGYTPEFMVKKNKAERNIRIAQIDADTKKNATRSTTLTNLGRSYTLAGRFEEALSIYMPGPCSMATDSPAAHRTFYRARRSGRSTNRAVTRSISWADDLATASHFTDTARYFRGSSIYRAWGNTNDAYEELAGMNSMRDDDGVVFPMYIVQIHRVLARCLSSSAGTKQHTDIIPVATEEAHDEAIWALVAESYWQSNRDVHKLVARIPAKHINNVFGQLGNASAEAADAVLEAMFEYPDRPASVFAMAIRVAPRLAVERATEWSVRLRQAGLVEHCPLSR